MNENSVKPIILITKMIKAILEGRKSTTRITAFPKRAISQYASGGYEGVGCLWHFEDKIFGTLEEAKRYVLDRCNYLPGNILCVKEDWAISDDVHSNKYIYKADFDENDKCRPKFHSAADMPIEAARLFLKINDVRLERLKDISAESAIAEGAKDPAKSKDTLPEFLKKWSENNKYLIDLLVIAEFASIWDSTVDEDNKSIFGWDSNPWVWVIEFEALGKTAFEKYHNDELNKRPYSQYLLKNYKELRKAKDSGKNPD